jgi:uncharacterized membrane protein SpoIIM required for sporulation
MILNLEHFITRERPTWEALDQKLQALARDPWRPLSSEEAHTLDRLYQRVSADLARISHLSIDPSTRTYLEHLVARGYAEIYGQRAEQQRFRPWRWWTCTFPQTFRRHFGAFTFACWVFLAGALFGGLALAFDPGAKSVLMPFSHLQQSPTERVAAEEVRSDDHLEGRKASFSGQLMTHNTQVALTSMALGLTAGLGTLIITLTNGIMLGAVALDYVLDGQSVFLCGWLLPHGVVEIPALLLGSQAGFVLAQAMLGRQQRIPLSARLRQVAPDVTTLAFGTAVLLVWAGLIEAFLSQYHEPALPYAAKIAFGLCEAVALTWFLSRCGRTASPPA